MRPPPSKRPPDRTIVCRPHLECVVLKNLAKHEIRSYLDARIATFPLQHSCNVLRRPVAEQLAQFLLVIRDAVLFHHGDEVRGGVAGEGRLGKVRVGGKKVLRRGVKIREIAASAARNQDLLANAFGPLHDDHAAAPLAGLDRAHQTGRAASQHNGVISLIHGLSLSGAVVEECPWG